MSTQDRKRLVWVALALFVFFTALIVQFFRIQIVEGEKWTKEARAQHQMVVIDPFQRGLFYSNTSVKSGHPETAVPLVIDVPKFHLYADPNAILPQWRDEITGKISKVLHLTRDDILKVRSQFDKKSRSRKLVLWLSRRQRDELLTWWNRFAKEKKIARNALFFVQDYKRSYPYGKLLGQVLHTVREERDAHTRQSIPTGGLELIFDKELQGKEGKRVLFRSPRHPLESGKIISHPENGADVYLTINHFLQAIAEEEIEKAVKFAKAKGGWAVMMDPYTGEVFALAQYPWFNPSDYRKYFNDPKKLDDTKVRAVTDPYEPGSTIKPLTITICLHANKELKKQGKQPIFFPEEKIDTANGKFPGRTKPIRDTHFHKYLNMPLAVQKSSNIYMARMIQRVIGALGEEWYRKQLHDVFGFGVKTGIELPSESIGLLPRLGKLNPNGTLEWSTPTPFSMAFGHNLLVNSFQMVRAYGILANGGYDVRPTLVRKIIKTHHDGTKEILLDHTTQTERVSLIEPEVIHQVVEVLKLVTKPGGSASKGNILSYTEAGKTSTSEKIVNGTYSKDDHISTFIGFAPAKNPRFVLLVAIDEPEKRFIPGFGKIQMGGNCAAPAFRDIGTRALQYLGVEPDDPDQKDCAEQLTKLKELYNAWNH